MIEPSNAQRDQSYCRCVRVIMLCVVEEQLLVSINPWLREQSRRFKSETNENVENENTNTPTDFHTTYINHIIILCRRATVSSLKPYRIRGVKRLERNTCRTHIMRQQQLMFDHQAKAFSSKPANIFELYRISLITCLNDLL